MKKTIAIILSVFLLTSCTSNIEKEEVVDLKIESNVFNVYDKISLKDIIGNTDIEVLNGTDYLNTNDIGKKSVALKYKANGKKHKYTFEYDVIDGLAPVAINIPSNINMTLGNATDPCNKAVFVDNYDKKPTCEIEGDYSLEKIGSYNLMFIIKDSSENTIKKRFTLNVKEETKTTAPSNNQNPPVEKKRYKIKDAIETFKNENTMIGIDVSRYQGDIDYNKVKDSGVEFVMIRIGVQAGVKRDLSIDSFYEKNIKNAKDAGLKVGVYLYSTATNGKTAKEQAEWVIKALNGYTLDFPIAFDWENWLYIREYEISLYDLSQAYLSFAETIEKNGYKAMLYGSKYYLENMWMDKGSYPVWLAHYTKNTNYNGNYIMWQHSSIGEVDGISGDVDLDVYYLNK